MKQETIQMFLMKNGKCFDTYQTIEIQKRLEEIDDSKAGVILGTSYQDPTLMILIAFILGIERFFLDDIGLGILKIVTCNGCGIWWVVRNILGV